MTDDRQPPPFAFKPQHLPHHINHGGKEAFYHLRLERADSDNVSSHTGQFTLPQYLFLALSDFNRPPLSVRAQRFFEAIYAFVGLYFVTLFSVCLTYT